MLIFDQFTDSDQADQFAIRVRDTYGLTTRVCNSREAFDKCEIFPFELQPPIVLVERCDDKLESEIESMVDEFHGKFAGT